MLDEKVDEVGNGEKWERTLRVEREMVVDKVFREGDEKKRSTREVAEAGERKK